MCGRFSLELTAKFYERFEIANRLPDLVPRYNMETLTQKPAYRGLLARNRCLIPASGFYEWKAEAGGKVPYYIHPARDAFIALAGLFDVWQLAGQEEVSSFTIITTDADAAVGRLHDRMPVILPREQEDAWLDPHLTTPAQVLEILSYSTGVPLEAYPVSRLVNKPGVEGKELIQPVA